MGVAKKKEPGTEKVLVGTRLLKAFKPSLTWNIQYYEKAMFDISAFFAFCASSCTILFCCQTIIDIHSTNTDDIFSSC